MKPWVDRIREHGNEATQEFEPSTEERARVTLVSVTKLLELVFEMDGMGLSLESE